MHHTAKGKKTKHEEQDHEPCKRARKCRIMLEKGGRRRGKSGERLAGRDELCDGGTRSGSRLKKGKKTNIVRVVQ